jgi:hypothetical protein
MNDDIDRVIWITKERVWKAGTRNLISDKDEDIPEKNGRPTKCILKILLTLNTQMSNKRASHKTICTSMHYTIMLLNPTINLNLLEEKK